MSKFEIGDRVRKVGSSYLKSYEIGEGLIVVGETFSGYAKVASEEDQEDWDSAYDSDLELIQIEGTDTLTLMRYIKPATIEINGVEYLMPEKTNVA